jgi:hypothetical protein
MEPPEGGVFPGLGTGILVGQGLFSAAPEWVWFGILVTGGQNFCPSDSSCSATDSPH